ncbi:MAG: DNA (cytosine-5-)-methyltransferase [Thiobacillus sp.]|uniref:DNA cytosine methyltransferase n=1 Tax=Thiobacillus sp. TaxID=924 RepID=UPI00273457D5|nr:DNA (cytosine-5-)-methyltransferase [Thiobacillus sp.]MDP3583826.1 DNA (cytosine-5-)-methyltransferase [Thiobacillus sp.]
MSGNKPIPVVDLFAGPGGLGEGFSSLDGGKAFRILVSAEMEESAHKTLRLRSFYRILQRLGGQALDSYYQFCNGESEQPWNRETVEAWKEAEKEARRITLGTVEGNRELNTILDKSGLGPSEPWILIGGPPCQAYSLVGRARNRGKTDYCAEDDHRHFLYREYLKIIQRYKPAVFIMENVKGILSSKVGGQQIFHTILRDLADPNLAFGKASGRGYRIHSLVTPTVYERGMEPDDIDVHDYIIRSEKFEIPQARHRVILLGIRDDIKVSPSPLKETTMATVSDAIADMPPLRSKLSKQQDSSEKWAFAVRQHLRELQNQTASRNDLDKLVAVLRALEMKITSDLSPGALRLNQTGGAKAPASRLNDWYKDKKLRVWLNHEARSHMTTDLRRYLYAAAYAIAHGYSPKGHAAFDLPGLRPAHKNWESGKFADRFKVQLGNRPATTITSHISKDGHYFIHPDPIQCRSLTVREAARLQTFPDNYFFQGNRTQQFHQVGNAVPPLLAVKIAQVVRNILNLS